MSDPGPSMRPVLKAAGASSTAAVVSAVAGAVRVKLYAVLLGPAGMGVVSQVQTVANTLQVVAALGSGVGVSREVARARGAGDQARAAAVVGTARWMGLALAALLALLLAGLSAPLAVWLLGDARAALLLIIAAAALPFGALGRVIGEAVSGLRDYRLGAKTGIASSLVGLGVPAILVWRFGLTGAVASIPCVAFLSWLVLRRLARAAHPWLAEARTHLDRGVARVLLRVSAASLALSVCDQLVLLAVRARLIAGEGAAGNGLFQGVWALSQTSLNVAVAFLMSYSFARIQETPATEDRVRETNHAVRMTLLLMAPVVAAMILGRFLLIEVFLSPAFRPAAPMFAWQAGGDFLHAVGRALGVGVLAFATVRVWLVLGLLASGTFLAGFLFLADRTGLLAAPQAWLLSGAVYLVATYAVVRRRLRFRLYPRARVLWWGSALLVAGSALTADGSLRSYALGGALFLAWSALAVRRADVQEVARALRARLRSE